MLENGAGFFDVLRGVELWRIFSQSHIRILDIYLVLYFTVLVIELLVPSVRRGSSGEYPTVRSGVYSPLPRHMP